MPKLSPTKVEKKDIGRERLMRLVEGIVRSGIKLIPFAGSAIDQATFGIKDLISNDELRSIVERE